jgi:DNA-directed RNA polymerase I subunit RPA1
LSLYNQFFSDYLPVILKANNNNNNDDDDSDSDDDDDNELSRKESLWWQRFEKMLKKGGKSFQALLSKEINKILRKRGSMELSSFPTSSSSSSMEEEEDEEEMKLKVMSKPVAKGKPKSSSEDDDEEEEEEEESGKKNKRHAANEEDGADKIVSSDDESDEEGSSSSGESSDSEYEEEEEEAEEVKGEEAEEEDKKKSDNNNSRFPPSSSSSRGVQIQVDQASRTVCIDFSVHIESGKLLVAPMIEKIAAKIFVHETEGIRDAFPLPSSVRSLSPSHPNVVQTVGASLSTFLRDFSHLPTIDWRGTVSNNVFEMVNVLGVEAGRTSIMSEIKAVFGMYGISVDARHLELIADFMTWHGDYRGMNRRGISSGAANAAYQRMSFETTTAFLSKSVLVGEREELLSPSSSIVVGQVPRGGTGMFEIKADLR